MSRVYLWHYDPPEYLRHGHEHSYTKISDVDTIVNESERAFLVRPEGDSDFWVPKSKARIQDDGSVWVCDDFLKEEGLV